MSSPLSTLQGLLLDRLGLPASDGLAQSASLTRALNAALQRISTEHDWPWLYVESSFPTIANTATYVQTSPWRKTNWLAIGNDVLDLRLRKGLVGTVGRVGQPAIYSVMGSTIYLATTPDAVYTVTHAYQRTDTVLVSAGDVALLPVEYDDYAVLTAAIYMGARLKDSELLSAYRDERKEWSKVIKDDVRRSAAFPISLARQDW